MPLYYTGNYPLTTEQMNANALYITALLLPQNWTYNAIAGLLGNTQVESRHNPGAWQGYEERPNDPDWGYGLTQWTPSSKYLDWCSENRYQPEYMSTAIARLKFEMDTGIQYYATTAYPLNFKQFSQSTRDAGWLAKAFLYNYERPLNPDPDNRERLGQLWYSYITENPIPTPEPEESISAKWIYYMKSKWRRGV